MEDWELYIEEVLGEDNECCKRNAERWRAHLLKMLKFPIRVTGIEDFPWEEPYVLGGWDQREYEKLKETNPSHTDVFNLTDLLAPDEFDDVTAVIKRLSDGKVFHFGLSWLETSDVGDPHEKVLNYYSVWHTNY